MKKIIMNVVTAPLVSFVILLLSFAAFFGSCQKTVNEPGFAPTQKVVETTRDNNVSATQTFSEIQPTRTVGTIAFNDGRQLGAFDWYLKTYKRQWEVLANLPAIYRKNGLVVDVTYIPTKEKIMTVSNPPKYMMKIIKISLVKPAHGIALSE